MRSVTLLELLIAIVLLSLIVFGFSNIDLFSRAQVSTSDRRVKLQNDLSFVLDHMAKNISRAIGNEVITGAGSVVWTNTNGARVLLRVYVDTDGDGIRDDPGLGQDFYSAYRFELGGGNQYQIRYCSRCNNPNCNFNPCLDTEEVLTNPIITGFVPVLQDNRVSITLTACWDPTVAESVDNPCIDMSTAVNMPSVSTN